MGTIKIGSSKKQKGITISPRYVLFNNEKVKKIMHTTTEIWNHPADGLVPVLTSKNSSDGGYAFASSSYENRYHAWYAFDDSNGMAEWVAAPSDGTDGYIGYKFPKKYCVRKITVQNRKAGSVNSAIKAFQLQGSDDGTVWDNIGDVLTNPQGVGLETSFTVDNNNFYMYYRLNILSSYGDGMCIQQLQFYDNFYDS